MTRRLEILISLVAVGTGNLCAQPTSAPTETFQAVNGSVRPAPDHTLKIEVTGSAGDARGAGEIEPDGAFHFRVKGAPNETVDVILRDGAKEVYRDVETLGTPWEMQIGALIGTTHGLASATDSAVLRTVEWSLLFSVIAGLVELQFRSEADLSSCFDKSSILYILLLCFFNTLAPQQRGYSETSFRAVRFLHRCFMRYSASSRLKQF